jgi:hypothetical protein
MVNKVGDKTHFSEKRAQTLAALVMLELPKAEP